ncbi:MAG TPA: hypothetical protein ENG45_00350 [Candidatus Aenigmarchaeota archaeon]|nr:hypothetical protein [Candidatus Aenigmarchaeota archaeon]
MKGVSPLVAAVLLIAATMTIAAIIAFWTSGFVRSKLKEQENKTFEMMCHGIEIEFSSNPSLDSHPVGNLSFIVHYKYGTEPVTLTNVLIFYKNLNPPKIESREISVSIDPKDSYKVIVVSNVEENYTSVKVTTNCPGVEASWP